MTDPEAKQIMSSIAEGYERLAKRLDPYLQANGIEPIKLWF